MIIAQFFQHSSSFINNSKYQRSREIIVLAIPQVVNEFYEHPTDIFKKHPKHFGSNHKRSSEN